MKKILVCLWFSLFPLFTPHVQAEDGIQEEVNCDLILTIGQEGWHEKIITKGQLNAATAKQIFATANERLESSIQNLVELHKNQKASFQSLVAPLEDLLQSYWRTTYAIAYVGMNAVDENLRFAATDIYQELQLTLFKNILSREDLIKKILEVQPTNSIEQSVLEVYVTSLEKAGLSHPDAATRKKIFELYQQISKLDGTFKKNLDQPVPPVKFKPEELVGLPPIALQQFTKNEDTIEFNPANVTELIAILTNCHLAETRKKAYLASRGRARDNLEVMSRTLTLRAEMAQLLKGEGATWMDIKVDNKTLVGSPQAVEEILSTLTRGYQATTSSHLQRIMIKKLKFGDKDPLRPWDLHYFDRITSQESSKNLSTGLQLDTLSEFLPALPTMEKLLSEVGRLIGLNFVADKKFKGYAPGVRRYRVYDVGTMQFVGQLVIDCAVRDGKNPSLAYVSQIAPPSGDASGDQRPIVLMVVNLSKFKELWKAPLTFGQLKTLIHELGHAVHGLLAGAPSYSLSGFSRASDFMEIPSILFEKLLLQPHFLASLLSPTAQKAAPTVQEIQQAIHSAKEVEKFKYLKSAPFTSSSYQQNGVFLAKVDYLMHSFLPNPLATPDLAQLYQQEFAKFHNFETANEDIFPAQFFHPAVGMTGTYHAYLVSDIYVALLLYWFNQNGGMTNLKAMATYRRRILESSSLIKPQQVLEPFVGAKPDLDRAIKELF